MRSKLSIQSRDSFLAQHQPIALSDAFSDISIVQYQCIRNTSSVVRVARSKLTSMRISSKLVYRRFGDGFFALTATLVFMCLLLFVSRYFVSTLQLETSVSRKPCSPPPPQVQAPSFHREIYDAPLPQCAQSGARAESWLMVFMGHSGSSAMHSQIVQHPDVTGTFVPEAVDHNELEDNTTAALAFTRNLFEQGRRTGKVIGFKLRPRHILRRPKEWAALVRKYNTRILWNFRENGFKSAAGEYKLKHFNDKTVVEGLRKEMNRTEICKLTKCSFPVDDMDNFHHLLKKFTTHERLVTRAVKILDDGKGCVLPLPYERYLFNSQEVVKDIFAFLGVSYIHKPPKRFKSTSDNLCSLIENWDELCGNFFHCIAWRPMMVDYRYNCGCTLKPGPDRFCQVHNY